MRTFWAYRRILGLGVAVAAFFALYITVIAPAAFSPGGGRPSSAAIGGLFARPLGLTIPHPFCTPSRSGSIPSPASPFRPAGSAVLALARRLGRAGR
jgi:hypothetical protein